jgi:hypothetical protein
MAAEWCQLAVEYGAIRLSKATCAAVECIAAPSAGFRAWMRSMALRMAMPGLGAGHVAVFLKLIGTDSPIMRVAICNK